MPITLLTGEATQILKQFPNGSIDAVITVPPCLQTYRGKPLPLPKKTVEQVLIECHRVMRNNTAIYAFSEDKQLGFYLNIIKKFFQFRNILVWKRKDWSAGKLRYSYGRECEFVIYANKGKRQLNEIGGYQRHISILEYPRKGFVSLLGWFLAVSTNAGDIVLDPFYTSDSVRIACQEMNRQFIGIKKEVISNEDFNCL